MLELSLTLLTLLAATPDGPTPPTEPSVAPVATPSTPAPSKPSAAALAAAAATSKAEPKPEPKEPKVEAKADPKPEPKGEAKTEAKSDAKTEIKGDSKSAATAAKDGKAAGSPAARSGTAEAALKAAAGAPEAEANDGPPSLSKQALCTEVGKSVREQQSARLKLSEERKALAAERARLEALGADISKSREALRKETQRLEDLMAHRIPSGGGDNFTFPAGKPSGDIDGLAKTFKTMAPEQVANLLTRMDRVLSAQVLHHMRPADAGAVIEKLKPDLAADLVAQMATVPAEKTVKR